MPGIPICRSGNVPRTTWLEARLKTALSLGERSASALKTGSALVVQDFRVVHARHRAR